MSKIAATALTINNLTINCSCNFAQEPFWPVTTVTTMTLYNMIQRVYKYMLFLAQKYTGTCQIGSRKDSTVSVSFQYMPTCCSNNKTYSSTRAMNFNHLFCIVNTFFYCHSFHNILEAADTHEEMYVHYKQRVDTELVVPLSVHNAYTCRHHIGTCLHMCKNMRTWPWQQRQAHITINLEPLASFNWQVPILVSMAKVYKLYSVIQCCQLHPLSLPHTPCIAICTCRPSFNMYCNVYICICRPTQYSSTVWTATYWQSSMTGMERSLGPTSTPAQRYWLLQLTVASRNWGF